MEIFENRIRKDIKHHHLLSMLSKNGQDSLVETMLSNKPFIYPSGLMVIEEGKDSKCLFYIVKGKVCITCSKIEPASSMILQEVSGRSFFGEYDILFKEKRDACVYTTSDSLMIRVQKNQLHEIFQQEQNQTLMNQIYRTALEEDSSHENLLIQKQDEKIDLLSRRESIDEERDVHKTLIPRSQGNIAIYKDMYSQQRSIGSRSSTNTSRSCKDH